MHNLYFTRHGETVWNVENKICGMTDSPLTARGRAQAVALGAHVRDSGVHIDEILYSPLSRAADTALAIAEATGIPAHPEPRLREQCFGRYEGTPRDGAEFKVSKTHFADRYSGGESMLQLAQRIYDLLDELRADERQDLSPRRPQRHRPRGAVLLLRYDQRGVCRLRHPKLRVRRVYICMTTKAAGAPAAFVVLARHT